MKLLSRNFDELRGIARDFLNAIQSEEKAVVIALQGELGAGKTTFAQAIGLELGIKESMQSPTFVIMKIYELPVRLSASEFLDAERLRFRNLIHIDAYRLEKDEELLHLGWEEIINESENLVLIEWPENVAGIIPENAKRINFEFVDENTREVKLEN